MKSIQWVACGCAAVLGSLLVSALPARRAMAQAARAPLPAPTVPPSANAAAAPSATEGKPAQTVLRMYDVGDLVQVVPDRPLGQGVLPPTQLNGILGVRGNPYVGINNNNSGRQTDPTAQNLENLVKLIEEQIAPDTWRETGGQVGSIATIEKMLVVRQTQENQQQVADLLDLFRKSRQASRVVTVHADWLWLSPGDLQQVVKPGKAGGGGREVDPAALGKLGPKALYAHGQITCAGGQTVHLLSGHVKTLVENLDASVGTGTSAYQPEVDEVLEGAAIQVTPRITGESANVDVLGFVSGWAKPGRPYQFLQHDSGPLPATRPADASETTATANSIATMDRMNVLAQEFCTTARLPLGKAIVIGGMTLEPEGSDTAPSAKAEPKAASGRQLYLVLTVDAD